MPTTDTRPAVPVIPAPSPGSSASMRAAGRARLFGGTPVLWTDEFLNQARGQGDPEADALAAMVLGGPDPLRPSESRLGYNRLVDLADVLDTDPELLLVTKSRFHEDFGKFPDLLREYYMPMPAPAWVDERKLRVATRLWRENTLAMLGCLYAASLPACYLIKNGIPALYQTEKLREHKYIFQRIYETGLMLEAVMDPGGIRVVKDVGHDPDDLLLRSLNAEDPTGKWQHQDGRFVRTTASADGAAAVHPSRLQSAFSTMKSAPVASRAGRYLWGKGYITAKKVRLLHSSMRFMLLNPGKMARPGGGCPFGGGGVPTRLADRFRNDFHSRQWPAAELGMPVNQEDLAYTLLTFSYLLPKGLEHWGCTVTREQKEAFLHLWCVIGHVMGLRDDLLTDDWDAAEQLFQTVLARQGGESQAGIALTESVMWFLKTYLPRTFGVGDYAAVALISDQLGAQARALLSPANRARIESASGRFLTWAIRTLIRAYYRFYNHWLTRLPVLRHLFANLYHQAAEELVASWRDEYRRHPFYIPTDLTTWQRQRGINEKLLEQTQTWRERVFRRLFASVALSAFSALVCVAALVAILFESWVAVGVLAGLSLLTCLSGLWLLDVGLPAVFRQRPRLHGVSSLEAPEPAHN